jgi:hypothetical protein
MANVAKAVSSQEGFSGTVEEVEVYYGHFMTAALIYIIISIAFGVGAAVLSYRYNVAVGTGTTLTLVYAGLAFFFSYLYYPFYALVLTGDKLKKNINMGRR